MYLWWSEKWGLVEQRQTFFFFNFLIYIYISVLENKIHSFAGNVVGAAMSGQSAVISCTQTA